MTDVLRVAALVAAALEACGVRYLIGGSLASSFAGEPRSTLDVAMVAELSEASVNRLGKFLGSDFPVQARSALRMQSSFNVIHEPTGIKVDLFPSHTRLARIQMDRRRGIEPPAHPGQTLYFYIPEDILLQKLLVSHGR